MSAAITTAARAASERFSNSPVRNSHCGEIVGEGDAVRQPDRRQAAVDVADDLDALVGQVERVTSTIPTEDGDERAAHDGRHPAQHQDHGQRPETHGHGPPLRVAQVGDHVPRLLEQEDERRRRRVETDDG